MCVGRINSFVSLRDHPSLSPPASLSIRSFSLMSPQTNPFRALAADITPVIQETGRSLFPNQATEDAKHPLEIVNGDYVRFGLPPLPSPTHAQLFPPRLDSSVRAPMLGPEKERRRYKDGTAGTSEEEKAYQRVSGDVMIACSPRMETRWILSGGWGWEVNNTLGRNSRQSLMIIERRNRHKQSFR